MRVQQHKWKIFSIFIFALVLSIGFIPEATAQNNQGLQTMVNTLEQAEEGMTLWQMIQAGGFIMIVLGLLSIAATANIVFNFMNLNVKSICPHEFTDELLKKLSTAKDDSLVEFCEKANNVPASIALAGLKAKKRGFVFAREAMEISAKKEIGKLWQNISYLADLAAVAPLVGLLGTVLGMIQAFNVVAFQTAVVKPILLAGGVSKAMITTAGGLIVAIPVMLFYTFFRGKVQEISNVIETNASDIIKVMEESEVTNV